MLPYRFMSQRFIHFHCCVIFLYVTPTAAAKSLQSCPTLCDPIDSSPPGSPVPGILQALQANSLLSEPPGKPIPLE